jgi:hypothetical protein
MVNEIYWSLAVYVLWRGVSWYWRELSTAWTELPSIEDIESMGEME